MLNNKRAFGKLFGIVIFLLLAKGCAAPPTIIHVPLPPSSTWTQSTITSTATEEIPTPTPSPEPTLSPTPTITSTEIKLLTSTQTFTPEPAKLTLLQDTVCLLGANFSHRVQQYVTTGSEYPPIGQLLDSSWWLVGIDNDTSCWVYGEYSIVNGKTEDVPVMTPPPLPSLTPTPAPSSVGIYYILISENSGGPFGCGDNLIRFYPGVWVKGDLEADITTALNALFGNHNQYTGGLYNPIYQSQLKAKSVEIVGDEVVVRLAGTLVKPKDSCQSQRMHDQIWYTVSQFSPTRAVIYLNNALLGDLLVVSKK